MDEHSDEVNSIHNMKMIFVKFDINLIPTPLKINIVDTY
jgi:hypothetical protein